MQTVDFYPQEFHSIPRRCNPAFGDRECVIIVKENGGAKACVLHVVPDPSEAVKSIALFWRHERAVEYAEFFASNPLLGVFVTAKLRGDISPRQGWVICVDPLIIRGESGTVYQCEGEPTVVVNPPSPNAQISGGIPYAESDC